jgi:hypothetical protein
MNFPNKAKILLPINTFNAASLNESNQVLYIIVSISDE